MDGLRALEPGDNIGMDPQGQTRSPAGRLFPSPGRDTDRRGRFQRRLSRLDLAVLPVRLASHRGPSDLPAGRLFRHVPPDRRDPGLRSRPHPSFRHPRGRAFQDEVRFRVHGLPRVQEPSDLHPPGRGDARVGPGSLRRAPSRGTIEALLEQSERLSLLTDNVLSFARLEEGEREFNSERSDASAFLAEVLSPIRERVRHEGFEVELEVEEPSPSRSPRIGRPVPGCGDLVDNAVEYSGAVEEGLGRSRRQGRPFHARGHGFRSRYPQKGTVESFRPVLPRRRRVEPDGQGQRPRV